MGSDFVVAHHEAGHAVVAYKLGVDFGRITMETTLRPDLQFDWAGRLADVENKGVAEESLAKIGVAGSLAQIKVSLVDSLTETEKCSTQILSRSRILDCSGTPITEALLATLDDSDDESRLSAKVELESPSGRFSSTVFLGESADDMALVARAIGKDYCRISRIVSETKDLIDDVHLWDAILGLAQRLMKKNAYFLARKELNGNVVKDVIKSALDLLTT